MTSFDIPHREWWVLRWLDLLEKYRFKKRLERGRRYAREGYILSIKFEDAQVKAIVQGSAEEPYELAIWLDRFSNKDWDVIIDNLAQKARYSAQLLASEMPEDVDDAFVASGASLFPFSLSEVHSRCSCPDPENPCKHIAAVYYELGDRLSEDPFVLFQLRGRSREQILDAIRERRSQSAPKAPPVEAAIADNAVAEPSDPDDKTLLLNRFWHYDEPLDSSLAAIAAQDNSTVLELLGWLPLPAEEARAVRMLVQQTFERARESAPKPEASEAAT
nr:SWIM zinc finger family protein [Rubidibacter lacunae]